MDLGSLIQALSEPSAYPHPVMEVEVCQTHISVVFLAGPYAYKVKKPVDMGFLDFSTLEKRRHFCNEEVRLNRRLAPTVYLGVVPVSRAGMKLRIEGSSEIIEWAVKMERLPEEATLQSRLQREEVGPELVEMLARKIAGFHAHADTAKFGGRFDHFETVARNARENFEQSAPQVGATVSAAVFKGLRALTEEVLARLRPLIDSRAGRGLPRDTHGDLHLDHVYFFPERKPPADLVIVDCIEFNERFRFADPVADMAFLVMDLAFQGRRDLAEVFSAAYFRASGDEEGLALLPFYTAYRAVVRGKVEGFELSENEIPGIERTAALVRARAHWLWALGELEEPRRRPCLVLVGGLPGTGKSTLARDLAERAGFCVIRSDVVRKEIARTSGQNSPGFADGIYSAEWTERTYTECLRRAEESLFEGKRVVVDASFRDEAMRRTFTQAESRWGIPGAFLLCQAEPEVVLARLQDRRNDASDADCSIYCKVAESWQEPTDSESSPDVWKIPTGGTREQAVSVALEALRELRVYD